MKIALDAMGGDFAPQAIVEGAGLAVGLLPAGCSIVLIGQQEVVAPLINLLPDKTGFELVHAPEIIEMGEHPTKAFSQKPNSSIAIGFDMLSKGQADVFCSAGNTGAMLVGAMFSVRTIAGILRPAIINFVPKENGGLGIMLDVGANAEVKPEMLNQFGELGSLYAQYVLGIANPKIALMNLGQEEQKGTSVSQAAYQLLKSNSKINFVGNIEGRNVFDEKADVIVCDGFVGNVILKMAESMYEIMHRRGLPEDSFFKRLNYESIGGSPILGVQGNIIIGHGVSSPIAVKNMILQAVEMAKSEIKDKITAAFHQLSPPA